MRDLSKGDTIKCHDAMEAVETMSAIEADGYECDFMYLKEGKKGLWLVITKVPRPRKKDV